MKLALAAVLLAQDAAIPDVVERVAPAVVSIYMTREAGHGMGSGVLVSPDGLILTNNHVIDRAREVRVVLADRREFKARVLGADRKTDLALLRVEGRDLPHVPFGDSGKIRVGETVLAVGNPLGVGQTVSRGIVSAKGRANVGIVDYEDFLQTDAAINPGNSGGALVNLKGELVGVPTAIASRTGGFQGIGFAIPSNMARDVMEILRRDGRVRRAQMGVIVQDMTPTLARAMEGAPDRGALVGDVLPGGAAEAAGVRRGDILRKLDGAEVETSAWLRNRVALKGEGGTVRLELWREGKILELPVKLRGEEAAALSPLAERRGGDEPDAPGEDSGLPGVTVTPTSPLLLRRLNLPRGLSGLVILSIDRGRVSPWVGLREGDVVTEVNRRPVGTLEDLRRELRADAGDSVLLTIRRPTGAFYVAVPRDRARPEY